MRPGTSPSARYCPLACPSSRVTFQSLVSSSGATSQPVRIRRRRRTVLAQAAGFVRVQAITPGRTVTLPKRDSRSGAPWGRPLAPAASSCRRPDRRLKLGNSTFFWLDYAAGMFCGADRTLSALVSDGHGGIEMFATSRVRIARRRLLKSIAVGSGAVATTRTLPETWGRPVVESVLLPAHAQTTIVPGSPGSPIDSSCVGGCFERIDTNGSVFWDSQAGTVDFYSSNDCSGDSVFSSPAVVAGSPAGAAGSLPCSITSVESLNESIFLPDCNVFYCD